MLFQMASRAFAEVHTENQAGFCNCFWGTRREGPRHLSLPTHGSEADSPCRLTSQIHSPPTVLRLVDLGRNRPHRQKESLRVRLAGLVTPSGRFLPVFGKIRPGRLFPTSRR